MGGKDRRSQPTDNLRNHKDKMSLPAARIVSHSDGTGQRPTKMSQSLPSGSDRNYSAPLARVDDSSPSPFRRTGHQLAHSTSMARVSARKEFLKATHRRREEYYTNPESIPPSNVSFSRFCSMYPKFIDTQLADDIRRAEYDHLESSGHVCFDYSGFGLFSHRLQELYPSCSSFSLAYVTGNLATHALYGAADEGTVEGYIRRRILDYLNVNEADYSMVFTASRGTAFKLLAESYPFQSSDRLLTAYDHDSESVKWMVEGAKRQGARVMTTRFKWPSLRICSTDLKKQMQERRRKKDTAKGLFVFPAQSRVTGAKYSYQWMSHAQSNNWHVLLDATALGPKDMGSLGLSLFRPDFIIASFYKIFGADPTGFGCLFIKNSVLHCLNTSSRARGVGMVRIVPTISSADGGSNVLQEGITKTKVDVEEEVFSLPSPGGIPAFSGPVASFYANAQSGSLFLEGSNHVTGNDGDFTRYQHHVLGMTHDTPNGSHSGGHAYGNVGSSQDHFSSELAESVSNYASGSIFPSGNVFPSGSIPASSKLPRSDYFPGDPDKQLPKLRDSSAQVSPEVLTSRSQQVDWNRAYEEHIEGAPDDSVDGDDVSFSCNVIESQPVKQEATKLESAPSFTFSSPLFRPGQADEKLNIKENSGGRTEILKQVQIPALYDDSIASTAPVNGHIDQAPPPLEQGSSRRFYRTQPELEWPSHSGQGSLLSRETERDYGLYGSRKVEGSDTRKMLTALSRELHLAAAKDGEAFEQANDALSRRNKDMGEATTSSQEPIEYYEESSYTENEADEEDDSFEIDEADDDWDPLVLCSGLDHADAVGLTKTNLRLRFLTNWLVYSLLQLRHPGPERISLVHIYGPKVKFDRGQAVSFNICDWAGKLLQPGLVQRLADRCNIGLSLGIIHNMSFQGDVGNIPGLIVKEKKGRSSDGENENACIPVVIAGLGFLTNFEDVYRLWHFVAKFLDVDFVAREVWRYHSLNQETIVMGSADEALPVTE